jgi:hypothetical protein
MRLRCLAGAYSDTSVAVLGMEVPRPSRAEAFAASDLYTLSNASALGDNGHSYVLVAPPAMPVVSTSIVARAVVTTSIITVAIIATISAVPIGITIVSGPGARSIYHRRTIDNGRRRVNNRRTSIHGARHADADTDTDRHTTGLRKACQPCT